MRLRDPTDTDQSVTSKDVFDGPVDCAIFTIIYAFHAFHRTHMIERTCAEKTHGLNDIVTLRLDETTDIGWEKKHPKKLYPLPIDL